MEVWNLLRNLLQMLVLGPLIVLLPEALQSFLIKKYLKLGLPIRLSRDGIERWLPGHISVCSNGEYASYKKKRVSQLCMHAIILLMVRGSGTYLAFRSGSQVSNIVRNMEVSVMATNNVDPDTFHGTDWPKGSIAPVLSYANILKREIACSIREGDDIVVRAYDYARAKCFESAARPTLIRDCFKGKTVTGKNCSNPFAIGRESVWDRDTISASVASTFYHKYRNKSKFSQGRFRFAPRKWRFGSLEGESTEITDGLNVTCYTKVSDDQDVELEKELAPQVLGLCVARFREEVFIFDHFRTALITTRRVYGPFALGIVSEMKSIGELRKLITGVELRTTGIGIRLFPLKPNQNRETAEFILPFLLGDVLSLSRQVLSPPVAHGAAVAVATLIVKGGVSIDKETKLIKLVTGTNITATVGIDAVIIYALSTVVLSCMLLAFRTAGKFRNNEGHWRISLEMGDLLNRIRDETDNEGACRQPAPGGVVLRYTTDGNSHHLGFQSIGEQAVPSERDNLRGRRLSRQV